jgi:hypothetical protein
MSSLKFYPARVIAALGVLIQSVIVLLALTFTWDPQVILAVEGVQAAFLAFLGALFVENRSASLAGLEDLQRAIDAGEYLPPPRHP